MKPRRRSRRLCGTLAAVGLAILFLTGTAPARAASFTASSVAMRAGNPTLLVDGQPFFFYGAAFFYERMPPSMWRPAMLALAQMGFNTLDLYVPWNWHETADGDFDFDGHSNPSRNLRAVLALAHELHFKLVVRPGPVIRNEWRNGGYPAWLLTRPEYGMPLHDILEGRYPATATLQNANSDDAAAQWLQNATHMRYATRWLQTALREFAPVADSVVAIALDDDQGAYIDNETWPAPHLQAYLTALEGIVRAVVGPQLPVFINTYEMKVTASTPVWAMGNWYQSDAYSIGEHDRAALEFSAGLLQTQTRYPLAMSEFQAGWLAPPEDPRPRPADPTNTTLALHTLLGLGMRGAIDFPAQDTINPAGWEAPFANAAYAWDAALDADLNPSARYEPTKRFGDLVRANGAELAAARRLADGAIVYLTSAYDERRIANTDVFAIVARTQQAQQACRARHLTCDLVDLRFGAAPEPARYPFLIVPREATTLPLTPLAARRLAQYRAAGGRIVAAPPDVISPVAGGLADATILQAADGTLFLDLLNYDDVARAIPATRLHLPDGRIWDVGPLRIPARDAVLLRDGPLAPATPTPTPRPPRRAQRACPSPFGQRLGAPMPVGAPHRAFEAQGPDGYPRVTLADDRVALTVTPDAGGRAFVFTTSTDGCTVINAFTSVGALRDDVAIPPPLSTTDRIGKYTRSFPAGMFNRRYRVAPDTSAAGTAVVTLDYTAPDVVPSGANFERTLSLDPTDTAIDVRERVTFGAGADAQAQRAVRYDSFDSRDATVLDERDAGAVGFFWPAAGAVAIAAWLPAGIEEARIIPERTSTVLRLQFAPGEPSHTRYALEPAGDVAAARAMLLKERRAVAANP